MANYQSNYSGQQIDTAIAKVNSITSTAAQLDQTVTNVNNLNTTIANAIAQAKLAMYPVGSIYMSVNATNPATFIGGTWVRITDVFLLASGNTYSPGATGGAATVTLTVNQIPSHKHMGRIAYNQAGYGINLPNWSGYVNSWTSPLGNTQSGTLDDINSHRIGETDATGGGAAHNNMPPYLAVYVWQRTA